MLRVAAYLRTHALTRVYTPTHLPTTGYPPAYLPTYLLIPSYLPAYAPTSHMRTQVHNSTSFWLHEICHLR